MSLLVVSELLGLFAKTLTADHKYFPPIIIMIIIIIIITLIILIIIKIIIILTKSLFDIGYIITHNEKFTQIA